MGLNNRLPGFLAPSPEKAVHWSDEWVHTQLVADAPGYIDFLDRAFEDLALGRLVAELPPKQILTDSRGNGDFRTMPCSTERSGRVCKTVKIVGTNLAQIKVPGQITVGQAYVLDSIENFITHTVDACLLSSARTGACAVLGARKLGSYDSIGIVGCGRVGFYTALYAKAALPVRKLCLMDSDQNKARQLADYLNSIGLGRDVRIAETSLGEALAQPVAVLATTSRTAIASPSNCQARLVVSLGADADDQSELAVEWTEVNDLAIVVDTHDSKRFGDLKAWSDMGKINQGRICDLASIYRNEQALAARALFVSTGSALFDNLTLRYLLRMDEES
jgi:ornithine cyclodeaminase/alanine dehydrogenase-like protein (mu-crystallin family)